MHLLGLLILGSPLVFISLPNPLPNPFVERYCAAHIPLGFREGRCGCGWILEALIVVPTSLKRGEGQMVGMKFVD